MRTLLAAAALLVAPLSAQATTFTVSDSTAPWIGFANFFELPENGGGFVFGSGWGIPDLTATFDDGAGTITLGPNSIGDVNEFWYQNTTGLAPDPANPGGPGQRGNKSVEANLFQELNAGAAGIAGTTVTFEGVVLSNSYTAAHDATIFIRDFASDFSSFEETRVPAAPGAFSIDLTITNDPTRIVQYGFTSVGENVWVTDTAPFGNVVIAQIPEPATAAMIALAGVAGLVRRRR